MKRIAITAAALVALLLPGIYAVHRLNRAGRPAAPAPTTMPADKCRCPGGCGCGQVPCDCEPEVTQERDPVTGLFILRIRWRRRHPRRPCNELVAPNAPQGRACP